MLVVDEVVTTVVVGATLDVVITVVGGIVVCATVVGVRVVGEFVDVVGAVVDCGAVLAGAAEVGGTVATVAVGAERVTVVGVAVVGVAVVRATDGVTSTVSATGDMVTTLVVDVQTSRWGVETRDPTSGRAFVDASNRSSLATACSEVGRVLVGARSSVNVSARGGPEVSVSRGNANSSAGAVVNGPSEATTPTNPAALIVPTVARAARRPGDRVCTFTPFAAADQWQQDRDVLQLN